MEVDAETWNAQVYNLQSSYIFVHSECAKVNLVADTPKLVQTQHVLFKLLHV